MHLTIKDSSTISLADYDGASGVLRIVFKNGGIYEYSDVSEVEIAAMCQADSVRKFFHANIRPNKPYERVS